MHCVFPDGFREEEEESGADPSHSEDGHDSPGESPEPLPAQRGPRHPPQPPEREPRQFLRGVLRAVLGSVPQPQPAALRVQRQHPHLLPPDPRREEGGCRGSISGTLGRAGDRAGYLREVLLGRPGPVRAPGGLPAAAQHGRRLRHLQRPAAAARPFPERRLPGGGGRGRPGPAAGEDREQQPRVPPAPAAQAERAGAAALRDERRAGARHHRGPAAAERPGNGVHPEMQLGLQHERGPPGATASCPAPSLLLFLSAAAERLGNELLG